MANGILGSSDYANKAWATPGINDERDALGVAPENPIEAIRRGLNQTYSESEGGDGSDNNGTNGPEAQTDATPGQPDGTVGMALGGAVGIGMNAVGLSNNVTDMMSIGKAMSLKAQYAAIDKANQSSYDANFDQATSLGLDTVAAHNMAMEMTMGPQTTPSSKTSTPIGPALEKAILDAIASTKGGSSGHGAGSGGDNADGGSSGDNDGGAGGGGGDGGTSDGSDGTGSGESDGDNDSGWG